MTDVSPEIERSARAIAQWHGCKIIGHWDGETQTLASKHGYGHWGHSPDRYAENHWREYTAVAEFMAEEMQKAVVVERERCAKIVDCGCGCELDERAAAIRKID